MNRKIEMIIFLCKLKRYERAREELNILVIRSVLYSIIGTTVFWFLYSLLNGLVK